MAPFRALASLRCVRVIFVFVLFFSAFTPIDRVSFSLNALKGLYCKINAKVGNFFIQRVRGLFIGCSLFIFELYLE